MDSIDDCRHLLIQAGWAVSDSHSETSTGEAWRVLGANGGHAIEARGATQSEAWFEAVEQARALGLVSD